MSSDAPLIMKVWENKQINQKLVTIPKDSRIKPGDYIEIKKVQTNG
jgi:hypothetical protein